MTVVLRRGLDHHRHVPAQLSLPHHDRRVRRRLPAGSVRAAQPAPGSAPRCAPPSTTVNCSSCSARSPAACPTLSWALGSSLAALAGILLVSYGRARLLPAHVPGHQRVRRGDVRPVAEPAAHLRRRDRARARAGLRLLPAVVGDAARRPAVAADDHAVRRPDLRRRRCGFGSARSRASSPRPSRPRGGHAVRRRAHRRRIARGADARRPTSCGSASH